MPRLTIIDAEGLAARGRPWTIRLEIVSLTTGKATNYWYATGRASTESIEIGHGVVGQPPKNELIDWPKLRSLVQSHQAIGAIWADTPYIRMTQKSIDTLFMAKLNANPPTNPSTISPTTNRLSILALGQPFSLIYALRILRDGVKLVGYEALDASGNYLLKMPPGDGLAFAQKHDVEIKFV